MITSSLAQSWMRGVATNPGASSEVLLRLLDPAGRPAWGLLCGERMLPAVVVEAVIAHPDRAVRSAFARNDVVDPVQRGRLAEDPDGRVRSHLASGPRPISRPGRHRPLPDHVVEALLLGEAGDGDVYVSRFEIFQELLASRQVRSGFRRDAYRHRDARVRAWAAQNWIVLPPRHRAALLDDPDPDVRTAARKAACIEDPEAMAADLPDRDCHARAVILANFAISESVAERCLAERRDLVGLAGNPYTPPGIVAKLARDPNPLVREYVAGRFGLDPVLLGELANDAEATVRTRALLQSTVHTKAEHSVVRRFAHGVTADAVGYVGDLLWEPERSWYEACAMSPDPLRRRIAATCHDLPAALLNELAQDPDADVRHLLALNHPQAPAALLLDAFIACPRQRPWLLTLPNLPRTGLAHLADHDDPEVRALAAADPTLDGTLLSLLDDPDPDVRRAAAANPSLPPARIRTLLTDPDLAQAAAANARLPSECQHELLDRAGIPPLAR
ncbi:hypothetical protein [Yinghuangia soli]|uniref:Leucine rich repeat (LRR) protein n=1 Tax=Yinghuangia soli TaxID=2908204 RepID=A0AA41U4A8_9ACTN|nr:hypothetical protein [Yinghuangia soli]MCF2528869.1 hypothetical protein [Yinghuangia soli]